MKQYTRKRTMELLCDHFMKDLIANPEKMKQTIMFGRNALMDYEDLELAELYEQKIGEKVTIKN